MSLSLEAASLNSPDGCYFFFDKIQYLKEWENYLKTMVDSYHDTKFIVSGSAAASGAGRFTDFVLPPLTFPEFIDMTGKQGMFKHADGVSEAFDIASFNQEFIKYIHYGGYPEVGVHWKSPSDKRET